MNPKPQSLGYFLFSIYTDSIQSNTYKYYWYAKNSPSLLSVVISLLWTFNIYTYSWDRTMSLHALKVCHMCPYQNS